MRALPPFTEGAMGHISQSSLHNRLLRAMSADDFGILQPHLIEKAQKRGDVIIEPNAPIEHVHFPERGITSIVAASDDGRRLEVGLYGREGMSGTTLVLDRSHATRALLSSRGLGRS